MMSDPVSIARGFSGLVTRVNPTSLSLNKSGYAPLSSCLNVDIDDAYELSVRHGHELLEAGGIGNVHSCYSSKEIDFIVFCDGNALSLYQLADAAVIRIRNITPDAPMEYEISNGLIYYTNGIEQGVIDIATHTNRPWEIETEYHGPVTTRTFSNPPKCSLIHRYKARMYAAYGDIIFISEPFDNARFVMDEGNILLKSDVTMITSTDNCLITSDNEQLMCFMGNDPDSFNKKILLGSPAINGTQQQVYPSDVGLEGQGLGVIMLTMSGIIYITDDGILVKLSEDKISMPKVTDLRGSSFIRDGKYVCQCNTVL